VRPGSPRPGSPTVGVRLIMLALALAGGTVDAGTYLGLGHAFPANMTGNTVLLTIAVAKGTGAELVRSAAALGGFCLGVAGGTALLREGARRWPQGAWATFALETLALALLLACWLVFGVGTHFGLIAAASLAMGAQSAAVRASKVGGVSTTYVTGTLTTGVSRVVRRLLGTTSADPPSPALPVEAWVAYALGGLAGAFAERAWHAWEMVIPLALVVLVTGLALRPGPTQER